MFFQCSEAPRQKVLNAQENSTPDLIRVIFKKGEKKAKLRGTGLHVPVSGTLPFKYFPRNQIVEDVMHLSWKGSRGRLNGFLALRCGNKHVGALPGEGVNERGWVELGEVYVKKIKPKKNDKTKSKPKSETSEEPKAKTIAQPKPDSKPKPPSASGLK